MNLYIHMSLDFLHIAQPNQQIATDCMYEQIRESNCLPLSQTLRLTKMENNSGLLTNLFFQKIVVYICNFKILNNFKIFKKFVLISKQQISTDKAHLNEISLEVSLNFDSVKGARQSNRLRT